MLTEVPQGTEIRQQAATAVDMCLVVHGTGGLCGMARREQSLLAGKLAGEGSLYAF